MSSQANSCLPYPSGHIQYAFNMYVDHDTPIFCKVLHLKVGELVFEKVNPADQFDPEWLMTINLDTVYSIEEVHNIGDMVKDDILDMLSLILDTRISDTRVVGHGLAPRPGEGGIAHILGPPCKLCATGKVGGFKLNSKNIQDFQNALLKISSLRYKPLIGLFRYAIRTDEPVVQFIILYLILYEMHKTQQAVDKYIMKVAPTTPQELSPHTRKLETIYTKLRNEITHRTNVGPETTRAEVMNYLDDFRRIVHEAMKSRI